jgi:hypothetical protein
MPIFQCYFFSGNRIDYVENLECDNVATLRSVLERLLSDREWDAAQAWKHDRLICEVGKLSESPSWRPDVRRIYVKEPAAEIEPRTGAPGRLEGNDARRGVRWPQEEL